MIEVSVGDKVKRIIGGSIVMALKVTEVTEKRIVCGPWEFSRENGMEIDEDLGWDENGSGSWIKKGVRMTEYWIKTKSNEDCGIAKAAIKNLGRVVDNWEDGSFNFSPYTDEDEDETTTILDEINVAYELV